MEYLVESIALGIDSIILVSCIRQYYKKKNSVAMIMCAPYLNVDKDLPELIRLAPESKLSCCSIRASVKPLGNPIISSNNPNVQGVIQFLRIKEHVVQRSSAGFWADSERTIQEIYNVMPFGLEAKGITVEVTDPLVAELLDMDVISDTFHPTVPTMMDHIWGFFAGVRQRGIQSTEKMLRQGTILTGIGELVYSEQDKMLKLQPPSSGAPYYLTTMTVASLVKKIEASMRNYKYLCIVFGTIGMILSGILLRRYLKHKKQKKKDEERKVKMEETRKRRRRENRDSELPENQACVVCKINPIEVILLPCGHVCLCEDCAEDITDLCPICRSRIETKSVAYIL